MTVRDIMHTPLITVREDWSLEMAANTMLENRIGYLPVLNDQGELCGIVTESDFACRERGTVLALSISSAVRCMAS